MKREQSGSTLIQAAIVMAIFSMFITLTVKGREMLESSHCSDLANKFRAIEQALYDGQFRSVTSGGTSQANKRRTQNNESTGVTQDNLRIADLLNTSLNEPFYIWQQIPETESTHSASKSRVSGYAPINLSKGRVNASDIRNAPVRGMDGGFIICSDNIPGRLAKQLDMMLDDGITTKGAMQISHAQHGGAPLSSDLLNAHEFYLACLSIKRAPQ
ncbi:hypothetical protein [Sideroxyarcus sp. TK5]